MSNIKNKLSILVRNMDSNRQTGHTTAVIYGANKVDSLVVCHSLEMTRYLGEKGGPLNPRGEFKLRQKPKNSKVECISLNSLNYLDGNKKPLVFDNAALHVLFHDAIAEIERLEQKLEGIRLLAE
jgi:hypothetical protein